MGCCCSSPHNSRIYRDPGDLDEEVIGPLRYVDLCLRVLLKDVQRSELTICPFVWTVLHPQLRDHITATLVPTEQAQILFLIMWMASPLLTWKNTSHRTRIFCSTKQ